MPVYILELHNLLISKSMTLSALINLMKNDARIKVFNEYLTKQKME